MVWQGGRTALPGVHPVPDSRVRAVAAALDGAGRTVREPSDNRQLVLAPSRERESRNCALFSIAAPDRTARRTKNSVWDSNWHTRSKSQQIQPLVARPASAGDACEDRVEVQNQENVGNRQVFGCVRELAGCVGRFPQLVRAA
jgi:hypothetical protein